MSRWRHNLRMITAVLTVLMLLGGCGSHDPEPAPDPTPAKVERRIVCLSPAMTQILEDLGHGDRIVAVSRWDTVAPDETPIVGDLNTIDYEKLLAVRPTDIVMQATREGVPAKMSELAQRKGWTIWRWPLEDHDSVIRAIWDPSGGEGRDNDSLSGVVDDTDAGQRLADQVVTRLSLIARVTMARDKEDVLVVVNGEPPVMAAAKGTYLDEMLGVAGGRNALVGSTVRYPRLDAEKLLSLDPDVIIYIPPHDPPRPLELPEALIERGVRVVTLTDRRGLLPSSAMPQIAADMAKVLYPEHADEIDTALAGIPPGADSAEAKHE